jgi:hypothetical protein
VTTDYTSWFPVNHQIGPLKSSLDYQAIPSLTTIDLGHFSPAAGNGFYFNNNALSAETIGNFLALCASSDSYTSGVIQVQNNTAPSGQAAFNNILTISKRGVRTQYDDIGIFGWTSDVDFSALSGLTGAINIDASGAVHLLNTDPTLGAISRDGTFAGASVTITSNASLLDVVMHLRAVVGQMTVQDNPLLTSVTVTNLTQFLNSSFNNPIGADFENNADLASVSFPDLVTSGYVYITNNPNLASVNFPKLQTLLNPIANWSAIENSLIPTISFPQLTAITVLFITSNSLLTSVSFPLLVSTEQVLNIAANPLLTTIDIPSFVPANGNGFDFSGNALTVANVNAILARFAAATGFTGGIDVSGGTSAAPTGQGIIDVATLVGRGVEVTTN